jgi:hypothetical protein
MLGIMLMNVLIVILVQAQLYWHALLQLQVIVCTTTEIIKTFPLCCDYVSEGGAGGGRWRRRTPNLRKPSRCSPRRAWPSVTSRHWWRRPPLGLRCRGLLRFALLFHSTHVPAKLAFLFKLINISCLSIDLSHLRMGANRMSSGKKCTWIRL